MTSQSTVVELKAKGNAAFNEEKWEEAKDLYTMAIELAKLKKASEHELGTLYSNRSATWAMLEDYASALNDADLAVKLKPYWPRGYARQAVALTGQNQNQKALTALKAGLTIDPEDSMLKDLEKHISPLERPQKRKAPEGSSLTLALDTIQAADVQKPLPVVVLSGFLGSGKTTLLHRILNEKRETRNIAVLVNDMAAINIDAELVKQNHTFTQIQEELVELTNGCVCCTLRGDLIKEATRLICMKRFDLLLIEATGISEPMPVAATFTTEDFHGASLRDYFTIDNMVTLVDGFAFLDELEKGTLLKERQMETAEDDIRSISQLLIDQVEFADTILINKCDLISAEAISNIRGLLNQLNPAAKILETVQANVPLNEILDTQRFDLHQARKHEGFETELTSYHVAETEAYGIGSCVFMSKRPFHPERLHELFFGSLSEANETKMDKKSVLNHAYRSKGFFYLANVLDAKLSWSTAGRSVQFEICERWLASMLPTHLWPNDSEWDSVFGDRQQQIVCIGPAHHLCKIQDALKACLLTDNEIEAGESVWESLDRQNCWKLDVSDDEASTESHQ